MKLAPRTRETVEDILDKIKNRLDSLEVEHSGVKRNEVVLEMVRHIL